MTKLHQDPYDRAKHISTDDNIIWAHGGDGTLLRAISKYRDRGLPFFGSAAGTANFLMNQETTVSNPHLVKTLDLLKVTVTYDLDGNDPYCHMPNNITTTIEAFNDIVLGEFNSWTHFDCTHNTDILGKFSGSALIISTPQGSTGANKNNGGVVLPLSSSNWAISGVTCNRNINYVIDREPITIVVTSRNPISLNTDGTTHTFNNVSSITISVGSSIKVIFNDYHKFTKKRRQ